MADFSINASSGTNLSRRKLRTISWCKAALPGCGPIRVAKKLLCVCVIDYQSEGDKVSDADRHSQQYQQRSGGGSK
jgi:hypothetical protein